MSFKTVTIQRAREDTSDIIKHAVEESGLRRKQRIFVKPNLSHFEYVPGVVTSPDLTFQLVSLLRDNVVEVLVGESDGFNYSCKAAFRETGMEDAVKRAGGTVLNLSEDKIVEVRFQTPGQVKKLHLPKTLIEVDAIVDLPLMKTHEFMAYSGAIKNLFGCLPSNKRIYLHPYLPEVFYKLYTLLKPQLIIMDARVGIEGNGPTKGNPVKMGIILTGDDALATDIIATDIMRLNWKDTYLKRIADKARLRQEQISVQGLQVQDVARRFEPPAIDLPVKAQMEIYKHEYLTKFFFCSLGVVKLFQKITIAYRGRPIEPG